MWNVLIGSKIVVTEGLLGVVGSLSYSSNPLKAQKVKWIARSHTGTKQLGPNRDLRLQFSTKFFPSCDIPQLFVHMLQIIHQKFWVLKKEPYSIKFRFFFFFRKFQLPRNAISYNDKVQFSNYLAKYNMPTNVRTW